MEKGYKSFWQVLFFLLSYFRKLNNQALILRTIISVALIVLTIAISSTTPLLFRLLIRYFESTQTANQKTLFLLLCGYGISWTFGQMMTQLRELVIVKVFCRLLRLVSLDIVNHLLSLSMRFHTFKQTGSIIAALKQAQDAIPEILFGSLFCVFPVCAEITIASAVITYNYGMLYSCVIICLFVIYFIFMMYASAKILEAQNSFNEARQQEFGKSADTLLNIETVKYFGTTAFEVNKYNELLQMREAREIYLFETLELMHFLQGTIIGLGFSITIMLSGLNVLAGKLLVSDFAMINAFVLQFVGPFMSLGKHIRIIRKGVSNMQNALQILDVSLEKNDTETTNANGLVVEDDAVEIEFASVDFGYFSDINILRNLSFKIPKRKMTAIVGSTGSGKSTITKLLFHFYSVIKGEILLNGRNLLSYPVDELTKAFGIVPQSVAMFNDTLRYNLTYAKPDATDEEIWEALRVAQLEGFVKALPHGFATRVGEHGVRLSGGEKQRLAIARAVLKKPNFFIFDEATSALDINTERAIQQSLTRIAKDITTLVIAHRLSTIINADQIIVLEYGTVAEIGTHTELLQRNGVYYKLWNEQFS